MSSPTDDCATELLLSEHSPEVLADTIGFGIQVVLSCDHSNAAENFNPECPPCDGANDVDRVLLFLDIFTPCQENLSSSIDVDVVVHSVTVGLESLIETSLQVVSLSSLLIKFISKPFLFCGLLICFDEALSVQCILSVFLLDEFFS